MFVNYKLYILLLLIIIIQYVKSFIYNRNIYTNIVEVKNENFNQKKIVSIKRLFKQNHMKQIYSKKCDEYSHFLLTKPRWGGRIIGPIIRYLNNFMVGILSIIILHIRNKFHIIRKDVLLHEVFNRPIGKGLLTVSNHQSVFDDPGIWGAILPFWRLKPNQLRWSLCTDDVFFYKKWLTSILSSGNVLPLDRRSLEGLEQPMLLRFVEKLRNGSWCHIFPEGRIYQNWRFNNKSNTNRSNSFNNSINSNDSIIYSKEPILGDFKYGVGKLIAHSYPNIPIVLPIYHKGMNNIIPEIELDLNIRENKNKPSKPKSIIPTSRNHITCYIGKPIDFTNIIDIFVKEYPSIQLQTNFKSTLETLQLYEYITKIIKNEILILEAKAYQ